jgi:hypothetical protein
MGVRRHDVVGYGGFGGVRPVACCRLMRVASPRPRVAR